MAAALRPSPAPRLVPAHGRFALLTVHQVPLVRRSAAHGVVVVLALLLRLLPHRLPDGPRVRNCTKYRSASQIWVMSSRLGWRSRRGSLSLCRRAGEVVDDAGQSSVTSRLGRPSAPGFKYSFSVSQPWTRLLASPAPRRSGRIPPPWSVPCPSGCSRGPAARWCTQSAPPAA